MSDAVSGPLSDAPDEDIVLDCTPGREGGKLTFAYKVTNRCKVAVYVMDALAGTNPTTGRVTLDPDFVSVWLGTDGVLRLSKGMPPMPEGTAPEARIVPLAVRLQPGEQLTRHLAEPLPLAEHSPVTPCGNLRHYRLQPILGMALVVEIIREDEPTLIATRAVGFPKIYFRLNPAEEEPLETYTLTSSFRTRALQALVRNDDYIRPM